MKKIYFPLIFLLFSFFIKSQVLLNENFNSGIPLTWGQNPAGSWSLSPNLGTSGSSCIFTEELNTMTLTNSMITPTLNINSVTNLTVSFKAALVQNNFLFPNIALYYNTGSGPQFVARWGSGYTQNTTYTVTGGADYVPPLDAQNVEWLTFTHTISAITGPSVNFIFDAEMINGGYALIDSVVISGISTITTGIQDQEKNTAVLVFPNPAKDRKIGLEGMEIGQLSLSDNLGKVFKLTVEKPEGKTTTLDLEGFPCGVYYLNIVTTRGEAFTRKLILK